MCRYIVFTVIFCAGIFNANPAKILGVYPTPSISHQVVFRALTLELVKRGHELVVITTDPIYKNKESPKNLREININGSYELLLIGFNSKAITRNLKRGNIMDFSAITDDFSKVFVNVSTALFRNREVNDLIENKNNKFDLVISEAMCHSSLIFGKIFVAPVIAFSSFYGWPTNYETVGAISRHPTLHPHIFRSKYRDLSFLDKVKQLYFEYKFWEYDQILERLENENLKTYFGAKAPTVAELKKNVVLMFVNIHPIFDGNRPVPPAVVNLGALHLQPVKALPQDLKSYLDSSKRGVIYVSLGTNVRYSEMEKDFLNAFLGAFEALPYDILWSYNGDPLEQLPENIKIEKWLPQRDLLGHPNIKAFVMQGGLQSTDEAIDSEAPLVAIPFLADQWFNANKYVELGIGTAVDSFTMTAEDLVKAVETVVHNNSYKENIKELKSIMQDQPSAPLERAVWWTEYILRHRSSKHLLGSAAQVTWTEYLLLDVLIPLAVFIFVLIAFVAVFLYYCIRNFGISSKKDKQS